MTAARVQSEPLSAWMTSMLAAAGLPGGDAALVAGALLDTSLHGVDTHGIALLPSYLSQLAKGATNPVPSVSIERHGAVLRVEADRGLGQVVVTRALDDALDLAGELGSVSAVISNVGHLGALGFFARRAAARGKIALVLQNGPPLMGLPGSTARAIGNNPIAFGAPVQDGAPLVFDFATSEVAYGKLLDAAERDEPIPGGWALDKSGAPTTDAKRSLDGILLPSGAAKGIGLAMMVEVLAGSLSGTRPSFGAGIFGAFLLVIDPASSGTVFGTHMTGWLQTYLGSGPDARYPGQTAAARYEERSRDGVPVSDALHEQFAALGNKAGIPFPHG
jgi:LDH2 family malate/lactate/ureidoglycolate dehydrogenase